jgi:hypothetical protein
MVISLSMTPAFNDWGFITLLCVSPSLCLQAEQGTTQESTGGISIGNAF